VKSFILGLFAVGVIFAGSALNLLVNAILAYNGASSRWSIPWMLLFQFFIALALAYVTLQISYHYYHLGVMPPYLQPAISRTGAIAHVHRCVTHSMREAAGRVNNVDTFIGGAKKIYFVIPSEARNLSAIYAQEKKESFLASLVMTKYLGNFSAGCLAACPSIFCATSSFVSGSLLIC
jgi:hypothetical protein